MPARLLALEGRVVMDVLRRVTEIDQELGITVWEEPVEGMTVMDSTVVNEQLNKLIERKPWDVSEQ